MLKPLSQFSLAILLSQAITAHAVPPCDGKEPVFDDDKGCAAAYCDAKQKALDFAHEQDRRARLMPVGPMEAAEDLLETQIELVSIRRGLSDDERSRQISALRAAFEEKREGLTEVSEETRGAVSQVLYSTLGGIRYSHYVCTQDWQLN